MVKALQELLLPDWNNAFIVTSIGPKGVMIPKIREKENWLVRHGHFRTEHRFSGVLIYDGPMTVKSLLRTDVSGENSRNGNSRLFNKFFVGY